MPSDVASLQRQVERITQEGAFIGVQPDVQQLGVLENEKLLVYRHPLFRLLSTIFEKCEVATNSLDSVNSQTFDQEIKSFIMQQAKEGKPFFTDDADTDQLMLKALQVLRIHLLEMEKVNELCKDFCSRYIACLKGKLNSENLMRTLNIHSDSPPPEDFLDGGSPVSFSPVQFATPRQTEVLQPESSPQQMLPMTIPSISSAASQLAAELTETNILQSPTSPMEESVTLSDSDKKKNGSKRGIFPKHATNIMKAWLFQHLVHPYPTEDEKRQIASQTSLTILQVNNWFINARRRILQPMLDNNTSYASLSRAKKIKPQKIPAQRAWPEAIGVYSAYPQNEGIQYHTTGQVPAGYTVVSPGMPSQGPVIVNVANPNSHQPLTIGSPQVQFVQVSTVPTVVQALPTGLIQVTPTGQATTSAPTQAISAEPQDTKPSASGYRLVASSSTQMEAGSQSGSSEAAVG